MCSTLNVCPNSRQISSALSRGSSIRSNGSSALTILAISASIAGKSSSAELVRHIDVVVKAVLDRRPKSQLHAVEQPHHRPSHHMRSRMPHDPQGLGISCVSSRSERSPRRSAAATSVSTTWPLTSAASVALARPRPDFAGHVDRPDRLGIFANAAVGEFDFEHELISNRRSAGHGENPA